MQRFTPRQSKSTTQSGTTMVELLVAVAILTSLMAGTLIFSAMLIKQQTQNNLTSQAQQNLRTLQNLVQDAKSWQTTIASQINTNSTVGMACLASGSTLPCTEDGTATGKPMTNRPFALFDRLGLGPSHKLPVYDGTDPKAGFTLQGAPCHTFDALTGDDQCPLRFDVTWSANCSPPDKSCIQAQAIVSLTANYKPKNSKNVVFNSANYSATLYVAPPCAFQDVSFDVAKNSPQALQQSGSPTAIQWDVKNFDTTNSFSLSTGKFQPLVPGTYSITVQAETRPSLYGSSVTLVKNSTLSFGSGFAAAMPAEPSANAGYSSVPQFTHLVQLNGSTDYIQFYVTYFEATPVLLAPPFKNATTNNTYANGHLVTAVCP